MPRYSLTMTEQEVKDLKKLAKDDDRSMASMMRVVFKRGLHVSISASNPREIRAESALERQSPDPARGHDPSTSEKSIVSELPRGLARRIADHLNSKAGTKVRPTGKAFRGYIRARLNEGYTEEDFIRVIDFKAAEWMGTDMEEYVRPQTLFSPQNFEKYAAQKGPLKRAAAKSNGRQTNLLPSTSARHGMGDDEGYTDGKW